VTGVLPAGSPSKSTPQGGSDAIVADRRSPVVAGPARGDADQALRQCQTSLTGCVTLERL
jgi:hypothetical protein